MDGLPTSLQPLPGGFSGETFLADVAGEQVVVRVYGGRSVAREPHAPEIDAAVLDLVRDLLPVPEVLDVRPGDLDHGRPGLLVTSVLPGQRLDLVLPGLDDEGRRRVGSQLGTLLGRLGHMVQPRRGPFRHRDLTPAQVPPQLRDLPAWVGHHAAGLGAELVAALLPVAGTAQDVLDEDRRSCLVHADVNAKNLLVDPQTLEITGVLDWEYAHAGSPYEDLGNLVRFERDRVFVEALLAAYAEFMPRVPGDLLDRARAADLWALVDLASRRGENPVTDAAHERLRAVARTGDVHATS